MLMPVIVAVPVVMGVPVIVLMPMLVIVAVSVGCLVTMGVLVGVPVAVLVITPMFVPISMIFLMIMAVLMTATVAFTTGHRCRRAWRLTQLDDVDGRGRLPGASGVAVIVLMPVLVAVLMPVLMPVIVPVAVVMAVARALRLIVQEDVELAGGGGHPGVNAVDAQRVAVEGKRVEGALDGLQRRSQVQQRSDGHVTGDARDQIQVQVPGQRSRLRLMSVAAAAPP